MKFLLLVIISLLSLAASECFYPVQYKFDDRAFYPLSFSNINIHHVDYREILLSDAKDHIVGITEQLPAIYLFESSRVLDKIRKNRNLKWHKFHKKINNNNILIKIYKKPDEYILFLFHKDFFLGSIFVHDKAVLKHLLSTLEYQNKRCSSKEYWEILNQTSKEKINQRFKYLISLYFTNSSDKTKKMLKEFLKKRISIINLTLQSL